MKHNSLQAARDFEIEYYTYFPYLNKKPGLNHYTSLSNLYSILEGDSLWVSNTRFSNDSSEEKLIDQEWKDAQMYNDDNYIICLCLDGDQLSQWRGYCNDGGVSLEMDLYEPHLFSILHKDYEQSGKHEMFYCLPLSVNYVGEGNPSMQALIQAIPDKSEMSEKIKDLVPYFKHDKFIEEKESRIVFNNRNNDLAKCIRYRDIGNHTKVPYIVVKSGNVGANKVSCNFDYSELTDSNLKKRSESLKHADKKIMIPQGHDQEAVFSKVCSVIERVNNSVTDKGEKLKIFCEGHVPIRRITIAPMQGKERIKEQIEHFCRSKYWLRYVDIDISSIPYVAMEK